MIFEWSKRKSIVNKRKHKVSFEMAAKVFRDPNILVIYDDEHSIKEDRYNAIGFVNNLLFVVFTERINESGKDVVRIISARRAEGAEIERYYSNDDR